MWLNPRHRHVRLLRALSRRWQRRVTFTGGALIVGLAAVGLARAADLAMRDFQQILRHAP
jgi:NADPH:quinone reductase-like Zn-dependent oxidoreductase